jgi:hypothetical protein
MRMLDRRFLHQGTKWTLALILTISVQMPAVAQREAEQIDLPRVKEESHRAPVGLLMRVRVKSISPYFEPGGRHTECSCYVH